MRIASKSSLDVHQMVVIAWSDTVRYLGCYVT